MMDIRSGLRDGAAGLARAAEVSTGIPGLDLPAECQGKGKSQVEPGPTGGPSTERILPAGQPTKK